MARGPATPALRMSAHHAREVILSTPDLATLSAFLRTDFPHAVIVPSLTTTQPAPNPFPTYASLDQAEHWNLEMFLSKEPWQPKAIPEPNFGTVSNWIWRWRLDRQPKPFLRVQRRRETAGGQRLMTHGRSPPSIGPTHIQITYDRMDEEECRVQRRIWRFVTKLTTNQLSVADWPDRTLVTSRPTYRAGHGALAWCRELPERVLCFQENASGGCICHLPNEKVAPPLATVSETD